MNWTDLPYELKCKLAKDPHTHPNILRELSGDEHWGVRRGVAEHPNTPIELLHRVRF